MLSYQITFLALQDSFDRLLKACSMDSPGSMYFLKTAGNHGNVQMHVDKCFNHAADFMKWVKLRTPLRFLCDLGHICKDIFMGNILYVLMEINITVFQLLYTDYGVTIRYGDPAHAVFGGRPSSISSTGRPGNKEGFHPYLSEKDRHKVLGSCSSGPRGWGDVLPCEYPGGISEEVLDLRYPYCVCHEGADITALPYWLSSIHLPIMYCWHWWLPLINYCFWSPIFNCSNN